MTTDASPLDTSSQRPPLDSAHRKEVKLFFGMAVLITLTVVVGFTVNASRFHFDYGRFPLQVHIHALAFAGWVVLYLVQNALVVAGNVKWHRQLGLFGVVLAVALPVLGIYTTIACIRRGAVPPFFTPEVLLLVDGLAVSLFILLVLAAIALRGQPDWHKRLMLCATLEVTSPAFGRLLPMPLLGPVAGPWAVFGCICVYAGVALLFDIANSRRVHPAWLWGMGCIALLQVLLDPLAHSSWVQAFVAGLASK